LSARVRAVVLETTPEVLSALERQTRPLDTIEIGEPGTPAGQADWTWLLDGSAVPQADALERLMAVIEPPGDMPRPALLASKVVRPDGSADPSALPVASVRDPNFGVAAVERRLLALRVARRGSLLVHRSGLEAVAAEWPRLSPFADDLEWTARLLKERRGLLVPASVAVRQPGARVSARPEPWSRLRLLLGDAVELGDKPWFAFRFIEQAVADLRGRWRR
jgi:hypothetical protein